jgi:hypothetical protein
MHYGGTYRLSSTEGPDSSRNLSFSLNYLCTKDEMDASASGAMLMNLTP